MIFAQQGNYYINNYAPSVYGAGDQNWGFAQDSLGRLYVANQDAIIMHDGKNWQIIDPNGTSIKSISKTSKDLILVGGDGNFGYLTFKRKGRQKYVSLSDSLPEKEKDFGDIWTIQSIKENNFFCSNQKIFWYVNNVFKKSFTPTGEKFHTFFKVENTLLVREQGVGLLFFTNGNFKKIKSTSEFSDIRVYAIIPYKGNLYWICSRKGLYLLKYNSRNPEMSFVSKVHSPVIDKWMIENEVYCGAKISQNQYALGSLKSGALVLDSTFKPLGKISYTQGGLQEDAVKYIYPDYAGNMWLALNKGFSYVQNNTPIKHWGKTSGIKGTIESVTKFNNTFYIASDKGVDKLDTITNSFYITDISEESWDLLNYKDVLLVGTATGVFEIKGNTAKKIFDSESTVYKLFISPINANQLFIATVNGLLLAQYNHNGIEILKEYSYASGIRSIVADKEGNVFFGGDIEVYLFKSEYPDTLVVFSEKDGIDASTEHDVFNYNNNILVTTDKGLMQYQPNKSPAFYRDSAYNLFSKQMQLKKGIQVKNDIWVYQENISESMSTIDGDGLCILKKVPQGFVKEYNFFKQIKSLKAHCFYEDSSTVYIGTNEGLISYYLQHHYQNYVFHTFISKIVQKADTALIENLYEGVKYKEPVFLYKNNELHFYVSASDYYDKNEMEFSYYLEGMEEDYGAYTKNDKIIYNNLHEGKYTLHVKSKNVLGIEGKAVSYAFTILPPWYRTVWAYTLYVVGLGGLIIFIVRYNIKRLKEQNIKLEKIIAERTREVEHQKHEIEHKNKEITDSINYAQRIQQAILPPIHEIKQVWKDMFVFYQPKDIVSGDFYWYHKISNAEFLIACADCTGHGVPGGFMSMICSDKLTDAAQKTYDPAEILFHVNNNVKKALRQNEIAGDNVNKDGMEVALLRIDFAAKKVWYCGANRLLWILRKAAVDIEEIKPTKASIASFTETDFKYTRHEIQLEKGDIIYTTSDGFPDQFGGVEGKKYMSKSMKKLILSIRDKEMSEQEEIIRNTINNWMFGFEQVDDLLVIAIKL